MRDKKRALSWLDRLALSVSPAWGLRRVRSRAAAVAFARSYDYDAGSTSRRTSGWRRSSRDANAAIATSLVKMRETSRDLRRNNGWARRGLQTIADNTVGWGIQARAKGATPELVAEAGALWKAWADSTSCDYEGRLTFAGLQRLAMDCVTESGEVLVVRYGGDVEQSVPLRIRVLEPDYIDASVDGVVGQAGGPVIQGVEFDASGKRAAYWLYTSHPGASNLAGSYSATSRRVPAANVLHVYRVERPGQARGVPWLSAAIARLNDYDDYDDAVLLQQKIGACFGAFVTDLDGAGTGIGTVDATDATLETLEPGHIEYLPPGKSISFATPPAVADQSFAARNLRRIAASLGVTYEDLTGDYSQVNFSSARMARMAHWASVNDWRWNMLIPQFCDPVFGWVMREAATIKQWPSVPSAEWSAPPMPMLEPDREGLAYKRLVRSGFMTWPQVIAERGEDPRRQMEEIRETNDRLDALKIWLDCDPRRMSDAGLTQARNGIPLPGKEVDPEPADDLANEDPAE